MDPTKWPDPAGMNRELHAMDIRTLLSVWPHFAQGTQFYDMLLSKGWLVHTPDGKPDGGTFEDAIGPNIDTTNPDAERMSTSRNALASITIRRRISRLRPT